MLCMAKRASKTELSMLAQAPPEPIQWVGLIKDETPAEYIQRARALIATEHCNKVEACAEGFIVHLGELRRGFKWPYKRLLEVRQMTHYYGKRFEPMPMIWREAK